MFQPRGPPSLLKAVRSRGLAIEVFPRTNPICEITAAEVSDVSRGPALGLDKNNGGRHPTESAGFGCDTAPVSTVQSQGPVPAVGVNRRPTATAATQKARGAGV